VLCQITSQATHSADSLELESQDFTSGGLSRSSRIRPERLFTADEAIISYVAGHITEEKMGQVYSALIRILIGR
jgi:mRNA interferase MazF